MFACFLTVQIYHRSFGKKAPENRNFNDRNKGKLRLYLGLYSSNKYCFDRGNFSWSRMIKKIHSRLRFSCTMVDVLWTLSGIKTPTRVELERDMEFPGPGGQLPRVGTQFEPDPYADVRVNKNDPDRRGRLQAGPDLVP